MTKPPTKEELENNRWSDLDPNDPDLIEAIEKMREMIKSLEDAKKVPREVLEQEITI